MLSGSSVRNAVLGSPATPTVWPGCGCSAVFSAVCWFGWAEVVFPAHTVLKSLSHLLQPSSLFPLRAPGSWPAPKSAGFSCSHKSTWMALRTRVLGKGERLRMTNEKGGTMTEPWLHLAKKHPILNRTEGIGSWITHVPDASGFCLISVLQYARISEQLMETGPHGGGEGAGFPGQGSKEPKSYRSWITFLLWHLQTCDFEQVYSP